MCEGVIEEVKGLIVPEEYCDSGELQRDAPIGRLESCCQITVCAGRERCLNTEQKHKPSFVQA